VAGSRNEGQGADDDGGHEMAGNWLKDSRHRQVSGMATREGGGDLGDKSDDERGPGNPDDDGERIDQGLVRDALAIEGSTHLAGRGDAVRERPAHEVPQRPRDPRYHDDKKCQGSETLEYAYEPAH
jgi:hypothetical protein